MANNYRGPGRDDGPAASPGARSKPPDYAKRLWYTARNDKDLADFLTSTLTQIKGAQRWQEALNVRHLRMYGGLQAVRNAIGFASAFTELSSATAAPIQGPAYNLIYSMVETLWAKLTKSKPVAEFLTDGGDYRAQRKAKKLNQLSAGLFYQTHLHETTRIAARDSEIFGTGLVKTFEDEGNVRTERVFPNDVWVDLLEGANQSPANMFQSALVDKGILKSRYPKSTKEIDKARAYTQAGVTGLTSNLANFVEVTEGWHLPSKPGAGDGRHSIVIEGCSLADEEWTWDWFPFTRFDFSPPVLTYWGRGIPEILTGHQAELNRVTKVEAQAHRLISVPRIWMDYASRIDPRHVQTNNVATIGYYSGQPPIYTTANATSENFVQYKEWIIQSAHNLVGASQLSTAALKPVGIDSAVGLREMNDIQSDRFMPQGLSYEDAHVDIAKKQICIAKAIWERTGSFTVQTIGRRFLKTIDMGDIDLDEDQYYCKAWPASQLPQTPAARKQYVQELLQGNLIDRDRALELLDLPDLQAYMEYYDAIKDDIDATIDQIIYDGKMDRPDGIQGLTYGLQRAQEAYLRGKWNGVPQNNLDMLLDWMTLAKAAVAPPAPPLAVGGPALGTSGAVPEPPPQSGMLPPPGATAPPQLAAA